MNNEVKLINPIFKKDMPSPTEEDLKSPLFNLLWELLKKWDVNAPEYYEGYMGMNGSHIKIIIDELKKLPVMTPSESVFGFAAWLTTRETPTVMSSHDDCAPIVELVGKFCDANNFEKPRENWTDNLNHPKE